MVLPIDQAVPRFLDNEDRMDVFANGGPSDSYTTRFGDEVPSIRHWLADNEDALYTPPTGTAVKVSGNPNVLTVSTTPFFDIAVGKTIRVRFPDKTTSSTVTFAANGDTQLPIKMIDGGNPSSGVFDINIDYEFRRISGGWQWVDPTIAQVLLKATAKTSLAGTESIALLDNGGMATILYSAFRDALLTSTAFTGNPTATTQLQTDNSTRLATTAFVKAAVAALVNSSPTLLDTLSEIATALDNDPNFATTIMNVVAAETTRATTAENTLTTAVAAAAAAANAAKLTSGDQTNKRMVPSGTAANNGVLTIIGGRIMGMSVASGQSGRNTFVTAMQFLTPGQIKKLVGKTLYFTTVADVTANFLTERPLLLTSVLQVRRSASTVNAGALVSLVQTGTTLVSIVSYTVTADDIAIGNCFQWTTAVSTTNAHSLLIRRARWDVQPDAANDTGSTAADVALDVLSGGSGGFGPVYEELIPVPLPSTGVTLRTVNGRPGFGMTIPAGVDGGTAILQFKKFLDQKIAARNDGDIVSCVAGFNVNVENNRVLTPVGQNGRVASPGSQNMATTVSRVYQTGTRRVIEFWFAASKLDTDWRPFFQNGTVAVTAQDDYFELTDFEFYVISTSSDVETPAQKNEAVRLMRASREFSPGFGPVLDDVQPKPQFFGGAVAYPSSGPALGWLIPAGQTGFTGSTGTVYQPLIPYGDTLDVAELTGCWVHERLVFITNPEYARSFNLIRQVTLQNGASPRSNQGTIFYGNFVEGVLTFDVIYRMIGDEVAAANYIQNATNAITAQDDWIKLVYAKLEAFWVPGDGAVSCVAMNERMAIRRAQRKGAILSAQSYTVVKTVGAGGDYATVAAAHTAITDASAAKKYRLVIRDGAQNVVEVQTKSYVDLIGKGRGRSELHGFQPDNTDPTLIGNNSAMRSTSETLFESLLGTATNMRYVFHADDGNTLSKDTHLVFKNCHIEHYGNKGAADYQAALPGGGDIVWNACRPVGTGTASGQLIEVIGSTLVSARAGWYAHDNFDFDRPCEIRLIDSALLARGDDGFGEGIGIEFDSMGAGQQHLVRVDGCAILGVVKIGSSVWRSTDPNNQPADRSAWMVVGHGNTRVPFVYAGSPSRALRIQSASTDGSSSITVSGSFVAPVFGQTVYVEKAGGGLPAAVYGWRDFSGVLVGVNADQDLNSPAYLLGDCRTINKTLSVTVDGGSPIGIIFDQDYRTGYTSQNIVDIINTALGAAATASLMDVTARYRPHFDDEEVFDLNTGATAILPGQGVCRNTDGKLRLMTGADDAKLFVGVALEIILPSKFGRVKKGGAIGEPGVVRVSVDINRSVIAAFDVNDTFGIDPAHDGQFKKGAPKPLLTAINTTDVRLAA